MAFRKPAKKKIGLKVLIYGTYGTGKTIFGLSFPNVALIDSENGATFYENNPQFNQNLRLVDNFQSFKELEDTIDDLKDNYEEYGIETLVIDSETKIYENLKEVVMNVEEKRARRKGGDEDDTNLSVRSWGRIKYVGNKLQNLKIDLTSRGVNVVSISQAKEIKKKVGDEFIVSGYSHEMNKGSEFDYDIVIQATTETDAITGDVKVLNKILKDRTNTIPKGKVIEGFISFDLWKGYFEGLNGGEKLSTTYSKEVASTEKDLEKEMVDKEEVLKNRVNEVVKAMDDKTKAKFTSEFKKLKINPKQSMTEEQIDKLEELLDTYENTYEKKVA